LDDLPVELLRRTVDAFFATVVLVDLVDFVGMISLGWLGWVVFWGKVQRKAPAVTPNV